MSLLSGQRMEERYLHTQTLFSNTLIFRRLPTCAVPSPQSPLFVQPNRKVFGFRHFSGP